MRSLFFLVVLPLASALLSVKDSSVEKACVQEDTNMRSQFQNKLAGICEDMCKEVGAYPQCAQCPGFVAPDSTPGVMTWDELLEHMDNLVEWGQGEIKGWHSQAAKLLQTDSKSCVANDMTHRLAVQNKLAGICEDMCKEVGAYPQCAQCPGFVAPDSTPGVMTWDELLEHMDNLVEWGQGEIKGWHSQAAKFIQVKGTVASTETACVAMDLKSRVSFQNKLAGICEDMCKEVGAYPQCAQCPGFVAPDSTPGVMTWDELLEHMDNLVEWGQGEIKGWHSQAAKFLQEHEGSCLTNDLKHRASVQNRMAGICEDMCKEVGAYPQCAQCPGFVAPDSTPGVMTWDELLEHMDNLVEWGQGQIKGWHSQAAKFIQVKDNTAACTSEDMQHRVQLQNKLAGICEDMCKEVGAYPQCAQCPGFVAPDSTPGVMTWDELLEHMDNLVEWGQGMIKDWHGQAAKFLQIKAHF